MCYCQIPNSAVRTPVATQCSPGRATARGRERRAIGTRAESIPTGTGISNWCRPRETTCRYRAACLSHGNGVSQCWRTVNSTGDGAGDDTRVGIDAPTGHDVRDGKFHSVEPGRFLERNGERAGHRPELRGPASRLALRRRRRRGPSEGTSAPLDDGERQARAVARFVDGRREGGGHPALTNG